MASAGELASVPYFVDFLRDAPEMTGRPMCYFRESCKLSCTVGPYQAVIRGNW